MVDEEPKPEAAQDALPEQETETEGEAPAEDAAPEPEAEVEEEAAATEPDPLAEQAARIAELEAEAAELRNERLRALADVENMRRRSERERQEASRYGATGLARDLLGVADNLRRALATGAADGLLEGVEMVERELLAAFGRHQIARIEAEGERFDHNRHQAMFEVETADAEPGTVVQVVQDGYLLHDRLLRPAMVGVAKAPVAGEAEEASEGAAEASEEAAEASEEAEEASEGAAEASEEAAEASEEAAEAGDPG